MAPLANIYSNQPSRYLIISTAVFLLRNENTAIANVAAINTK